MAKLALYRKYRPADFSQVSGQEYITEILQNSVKENRFSHAYIFCGPRGIGKTSAARIMAKAINCMTPKNGNPCNKCATCKLVNEQSALDIIEIDAASNRGIDEIRDLREKVKFTPSELRYKVFIIDEVHMLTKEAFNALLKTLEEPPAHAIFILATTEIHKLPATVISRCQRFDFKRISDKALYETLSKIVKSEEIKIADDALDLIASASEGGLRDAISVLDQISTHSKKEKIEKNDVLEILGIVDAVKISKLSELVENGNKKEALQYVHELLEKGSDIGQLTKSLLGKYRKNIQEKVVRGSALDKDIYAVEALSECYKDFKNSLHPQLVLEIAILKIMGGQDDEGDKGASETKKAKPKPNPNSQTPEPEIIEEKDEPRDEGEGLENFENKWPEVLYEIKRHNNSINAVLREAEPVVKGFAVEFIFPYKFHKERIEDRKNRKVVEKAFLKVFDREVKITCSLEARGRRSEVKEPASTKVAEAKPKENEILDILGGEVVG